MSLPSINPIIFRHHIKSDGSVPVKLRFTHNRTSKYLSTDEVAVKGDYHPKTLQIKDVSMISRLGKVIEKMENALRQIDMFERDKMSADALVKEMNRIIASQEKFELDFFEFGMTFASLRPTYSAANYKTALNSFRKFLKKDAIDISEITSSMMRNYEAYLVEKHGKDARAVSLYTSALAAIHADARRKHNNEELDQVRIKNPFAYYTPPKQKIAKKRGLEPETIQKLINIRGSLAPLHKLAVDVFLLSFATMGTNVPDLYDAVLKDNVIYYNRTKTRARRNDDAEMRIRLEPVCECLWKDMKDPTKKKAFMLHNQYTHYHSIADKANGRLKEIAALMGVPPFTMYSARHTWASFAYSLGIPKSLINDCLCHVDPNMSVTDIYIKKDWSVLWEANRKVLEQFEWK